MKKYLSDLIHNAVKTYNIPETEIQFDNPKEEKFGDLSTNIAMQFAKILKSSPRKIAQEIVDNLEYDRDKISKVEIAGAGFINFFISDNFYKNELLNILAKKASYGKSDLNKGKTANLEWVSANPTGPLHLGHGRGISLCKAIANLLEWTGYIVTREYYYNDAGNQMNILAKSVYARYMQRINPEYPFPEDGYVGQYVNEIAREIYKEKKESLQNSEDLNFFKKAGEEYNFKIIRNTLTILGINHDVFFNETSLYDKQEIENVLNEFKNKSLSYEEDGAVWLKMDADAGFQKDKVIVKSTGEPTYRLPDIAYHINKLKRGYDLVLDIFGSDHGDTYKEVLYGVKSLGYDSDKIKVIIHQMVTFKQGEETVKMSKRSDNSYYLDELIKDIGVDASQFFFIMRGVNTHLDFDIELAKEQSEKNPMYYLQYAHARICGILRNAKDHLPEYNDVNMKELNLDLIRTEVEIKLLKKLSGFTEEVLSAASSYEPHKIITFLNELAESFHRFYHNNRVIDIENKSLSVLRLMICIATQQVFRNGFAIIGVSSPEKM